VTPVRLVVLASVRLGLPARSKAISVLPVKPFSHCVANHLRRHTFTRRVEPLGLLVEDSTKLFQGYVFLKDCERIVENLLHETSGCLHNSLSNRFRR
jgi:hypothetical protein